MEFVLKTDRGKKRSDNQDSGAVFCASGDVFAVVADGMGGCRGGSEASRFAVKTAVDIISEKYASGLSEQEVIRLLEECHKSASDAVYGLSVSDPALAGMGSTLVIAALRPGRVIVSNTGDSRAYKVSDTIEQITKDQSYVQQLVDNGAITAAEARRHPKKNIIMSAIGDRYFKGADIYSLDYDGEYILLCSDGLTNMADDKLILDIMKSDLTLDDKAEKLICAANENGGDDNITVAVIKSNAVFGGIDK